MFDRDIMCRVEDQDNNNNIKKKKRRFAIGLKKLGEIKVERLKSSINARSSSRMKMWLIRATTMVILWTCVVQLTAIGDSWGPRVLKGWPSCFSQDSHSAAVLDLKSLPNVPVKVLPPKRVYKNNGYLVVSCNGGLNQMRSAVSVIVVARAN